MNAGQVGMWIRAVKAGFGAVASLSSRGGLVRALLALLAVMLWLPAMAQLPPTPSLVSNRVTLEAGATGSLTVVLSAPAVTTQTFVVVNTRADLVQATARVSIPVGGTSVAIPVKGIAAGSVNLRIANNVRVLDATVQVVAGDATLAALLPSPVAAGVGADARVTIELSAIVKADTPVSLAAEPIDGLSLPAEVVVPAGAQSAQFSVRGQVAGLHELRATLRGQTLATPVRVTEADASVVAVVPDRNDGEVGSSVGMTVRLSRSVAVATEVQLGTDAPQVLEFPAAAVVPAGADRATVSVKLKEAGRGSFRAQLGESSAQAEIEARSPAGSTVPPALTVRPGNLTLTVGGSGLVTVEVDAARSYDMPFALSIVQQLPAAGSGAVVSLPASVLVRAGERQASFQVSGLAAGTARLGLKPTNAAVIPAVDVTVSSASPGVVGLSPGPQPIAKGAVGTATVTIAPSAGAPSHVAISSDAPSIVKAPATVVVPAGGTRADVPLSAVAEGTAQITATLNGQSGSAQVLVGPAVAEELRAPATLSVNVGSSAAIAAQLLMTDGTLVASPAGVAWTTGNAAVATVDSNGQVSGISAGSATIEGVLGALRVRVAVTVVQLPQLTLSPANAEVAVGNAVTYTLGTTAPAPAGGLAVSLTASGIGTAELPSSVNIPAGASSATFQVRGTGAGALVIQAQAEGRQAASATLTVTVNTPTLQIDAAAPLTGAAGTVLTISGLGFDPVVANNVVRIGNVAIEVTQASATQLVTRVPISATTGVISVTNTLGTASGPVFTVQQAQDAVLLATPNSIRLLRGSEAATALSITSTGTQAYTGSLNLSIAGLPAGVSAVFEPVVLPADRTGVLRLAATGSVAPGTYQATLTGVGYGTAGAITRTATLSINVPDPVVTPSTGVRGRFITPEGTPIAGVIVRADTGGQNSPTVTTDAAGSFELAGLSAGALTLRFDATPANPLYPIWPFSVTVVTDQMILLKDFVISPPPQAQTFTPINNAAQAQVITDERFPGLEITLPAGAEIIGWDGVKKTQIAVEKRDISELPVVPPPVPTGTAYQLYFGTPMGGIPSQPIPISLPNDTGAEPGETVNVWFFDGSPMGGTGEWKIAGQAVVSDDGKVAKMVNGGLTRFCGVCGLACLQSNPPGDNPGNGCPKSTGGNPVNLFSGQELTQTGGMSCSGLVPIETGRNYNPIDAFGNIGGTEGSIGYGWALDYDVMFLGGATKRLVMPGNVGHVFGDEGGGNYRNRTEPRFDGAVAREASGNWQITYKDGTAWKFQPFAGAPGNVRGQPQFLVEVRDPNGRVVTVSRNSRGQLLSVGTTERRITATYGASTFIETLTDPEGRTERYTYTASKRIETVTDADGRVTRYSYVNDADLPKDAACSFAQRPETGERLKTITYPGLANPTENHYGSSRRILRQTTATGLEYRFNYRVGGACITNTVSPGVACSGASCPTEDTWENYQAGWRFHGGQVLSTTVLNPDGTTQTARFGSQGQVLEMSSSAGSRMQYQRDAQNRTTRMTDTIGRVSRMSYDENGNVARSVDALGRATDYTYDTRWNKPDSITRYDESGTAQTWRFSYDSKGNVASTTNPLGHRVTMAYSALGQLTSVTDPLNQTTRFAYNAAGDLSKVTDPLLNDSILATDDSGRPTGSTDALGYSTATQTNGIGQTTEVLDAIGGRTLMAYDEGARLKSVTNPRGNAIATYSYDVYGRLTARTDAAAKSDTYSYDSAGRVERIVDRKGQTTRYVYDTAGRVVRIEFPDRTRTFTFDGADRVVRVEEGGSRIDYEYDTVNRLLKEVQTNGATSHEVSYGYDRLDRRVWRRVDGAEETRYEWDLANRLTAIRYAGESTLYQWDVAGRLTRKTLPNGITADYGYDAASRLLGITYRKPDGAQVEKVDYTYDARGIRTSKALASGSVIAETPMTAVYDAADRMTSVTFVATGETCALSFDASGNLARKDCGAGKVSNYSWDGLDRLIGIDSPGVVASFSYDPTGRRTSRVINGAATTFVYDDAQVLGEYSPSGIISLLHGLGVDELLAAYSAMTNRVAIADAQGSVLAELQPDGIAGAASQYSAYGESIRSGGQPLTSVGFTGRESDTSGLIFYRARYYDPLLKRFVSEDPIAIGGGINHYAYVSGNPVSLIDPTGEIGIPGAIYGGIAGGIGGYISGGWRGAFLGAGAGALVGAVNPFAAHWAGAAAGAAAASAVGQAGGLALSGKDPSDLCNYDLGAIGGAALGGALGGPLNHFLGRTIAPIRLSVIGRPLGARTVLNYPGMTAGAIAEGALVGGGELGGSGRLPKCGCK